VRLGFGANGSTRGPDQPSFPIARRAFGHVVDFSIHLLSFRFSRTIPAIRQSAYPLISVFTSKKIRLKEGGAQIAVRKEAEFYQPHPRGIIGHLEALDNQRTERPAMLAVGYQGSERLHAGG